MRVTVYKEWSATRYENIYLMNTIEKNPVNDFIPNIPLRKTLQLRT